MVPIPIHSEGWTQRVRQRRAGMRREHPTTDVQDILHVRDDRERCILSRIDLGHLAVEGEEERLFTCAQIDEDLTRLCTEARGRNTP